MDRKTNVSIAYLFAIALTTGCSQQQTQMSQHTVDSQIPKKVEPIEVVKPMVKPKQVHKMRPMIKPKQVVKVRAIY